MTTTDPADALPPARCDACNCARGTAIYEPDHPAVAVFGWVWSPATPARIRVIWGGCGKIRYYRPGEIRVTPAGC
jgi:hypothetical protein